ncbi:MAG: hypothetical protein U0169_19750 [Polyangiaceae bacterium]
MIGLGFRFRERLHGSYYRLDAPFDEHPFELDVEIRAESLPRFVRDRMALVGGELRAAGLAACTQVDGSLLLKTKGEQRLSYAFAFTGDDGRRYEFRGEKDVIVLGILQALTSLPGSLFDDAGREVARIDLRFPVSDDVRTVVKSFRLATSGG